MTACTYMFQSCTNINYGLGQNVFYEKYKIDETK